MYRIFIRRIDIRLRRRHGDLDFVGVFAGFDFAEVGGDFVVAFGPPGDVAGGEVRGWEGGGEWGLVRGGGGGGGRGEGRTYWTFANAYTFNTLIYPGANNKYCMKLVTICHGSN